MNEEKAVVASIVHHFKLTVDASHVVEFTPKVILTAVNDIKLNIELLLQE